MMVKGYVSPAVARAADARARGGGRSGQGGKTAQKTRRGGGDDPEDWRVLGAETTVDGQKVDDLLSRIDDVAPSNSD